MSLDAEVAEKIMQWRIGLEEDDVSPDDFDAILSGGTHVYKTWPCMERFNPSASISDAWLVVEEMRRRFNGMIMEVNFIAPGGIRASLFWADGDAHAIADTAPEAIVKAALEAIGPRQAP